MPFRPRHDARQPQSGPVSPVRPPLFVDGPCAAFTGRVAVAPKGKANGDGLCTAEAVEERRCMRELLEEVRGTLDGIS